MSVTPVIRFASAKPVAQATPQSENPPLPSTPVNQPSEPTMKAPKKGLLTRGKEYWNKNKDLVGIFTGFALLVGSAGGLVGTLSGRFINNRTDAGQTSIRLQEHAAESGRFIRNSAVEPAKMEKANSFVSELFSALVANNPQQADALLTFKSTMSPAETKATSEFFSKALALGSDNVVEIKEAFNQWFEAVPAKSPNVSSEQRQEMKTVANEAFNKMIANRKLDSQLFWGMVASMIGTVILGIPFGALALYAKIGPMVR